MPVGIVGQELRVRDIRAVVPVSLQFIQPRIDNVAQNIIIIIMWF